MAAALAKMLEKGVSVNALVNQDNGAFALRDVMSGAPVRTPVGANERISFCMECDWPSMRAASAGVSGSLHIWDLATNTGETIPLASSTKSPIRAMSAEWKSGRCLTGSEDGRLCEWDLNGKACKGIFRFRLGVIFAIAVDWARFRALICHGDKGIDHMDLEDGSWLRTLTDPYDNMWAALSVVWNKARALTGSMNGALRLWDVGKGSVVSKLVGHTAGICGLCLRWMRQRGVTTSMDKSCRVWDLEQGLCIATLLHELPIRSLSVDWEADLALVGDSRGTIVLWALPPMEQEIGKEPASLEKISEVHCDAAAPASPVIEAVDSESPVGAAVIAISLQPRALAPKPRWWDD